MKLLFLILLWTATLSPTAMAAFVFDEPMPPPDSVQLIAPLNRALDIVTANNFLEWSPSANALSYRLLLTTDEEGTDTVLYEGNLGTTFYILPTLEENTIYYWKVRAENSGGVSVWSELRQFRTAIPDGEALVITISDIDSLVGYVSLNTQTTWNGNFYYSKVKSLSKDGNAVFTEQDFPSLFAQDFMVRRIDLIGQDGKTLVGHLSVDYLFTAGYPRSPRKDVVAYLYKNGQISPEKYPSWKYYTSTEVPIVGMIPPSNRLQSVRSATALPIVLVNGLGGSDWGETSKQLFPYNIDAWQFLYAQTAPIDSSAVLLTQAVNIIAGLYGTRVGIAAHSSGGLVARAMIQGDDYKENVNKVLMLGTPNFGSYLCYKRVYSDELNGVGNQFVQGLDKNSPLLAELSPASSFLFRLNSQVPKNLYPNSEINKTYLSIAGTIPMPLGVFHNETAAEEDGVVSVAGAGLMRWDIPFATVSLAHAPINSEDTSKNLLRNSNELIRGFFSIEYSPTVLPLQFELAVDGFWLRWNYTIKSDSRFLPGKSIMEVSLPDIQESGFTVFTNALTSSITVARKSYSYNSEPLSLLNIPETNNYFAAYTIGNEGVGLLMSSSPQTVRLADWIMVANGRSIYQERILPISCTPSQLEFIPLETTMKILSLRSPIMKSWFLGVERRQEIQLTSKVSDTLFFDVDTYMDTMVVARFLPKDTLVGFQAVPGGTQSVNMFRLIAPNGMVINTDISPTTPFLPYSAIGYENFSEDNVSYYFMAQPQPGRWKIISDKNLKAQFVQSYLSEVAVRIAINDSLYKPNDTVPFRVLLPKFFYANPKLKVRIFAPDGDSIGTEINLRQNDTSAYEFSGVFYPSANGVYRISADFSCNFPAGAIRRTVSRNIEIIDALPNIPKLILPANNDTNVTLNTILLWGNDSRAKSYQIQFSDKQKFTELISDTIVTDAPLLQLPKLKSITNYYWRVRANNRRGWTPWSEAFTFRTGVTSISTPLLNNPANGTVTIQQNIELTWHQSFRAKVYRVQISRDSLFKTSIMYDSFKSDASLPFVMQSNTKYYWRVKAIGADKSESEWSQVWNFKRLLPSPTPISPEDKAVNLPLNIRLKWYSPDLSLRFQVEISTKQDFSDIVFNQTTLGDTIIYASLPSNYTTFYWRVKWLFKDGSESAWSDVWSFTTMLAQPRLDSPGNKVTGVNLNPTLTWNSVPGGLYYHLQLAKDVEFAQKVFEDSLLLVIAKPLKELPPLTEFFWRVRTRTTVGVSEWSEIWSFKTGEAATGIDENRGDGIAIHIAPQPASGISFMELELPETSEVSIHIVDLLGMVVQEMNGSIMVAGNHTIPIVLPSRGVYSCRVTIGMKVITTSIVY